MVPELVQGGRVSVSTILDRLVTGMRIWTTALSDGVATIKIWVTLLVGKLPLTHLDTRSLELGNASGFWSIISFFLSWDESVPGPDGLSQAISC